jgi:hypothetical protein
MFRRKILPPSSEDKLEMFQVIYKNGKGNVSRNSDQLGQLETVNSSETLVSIYQIRRRQIQEDP